MLEILRVHARIPLLLGCSSGSLIANAQELEKEPGLVLSLYHLPQAELNAIRFTQAQVEQGEAEGFWPEKPACRTVTDGWSLLIRFICTANNGSTNGTPPGRMLPSSADWRVANIARSGRRFI